MKPHRRVFVVGGAHTPFIGRGHPDFVWKGHPEFGQRTNPTLEDYLRQATLSALETTGVSPAAIERAYVSNFLGECFAKQGHLGAMVAAIHPDLEGKPITRVEAACASGAAAIVSCIDAMQAGVDVTLAVGAEVENTVRGREGVEYMSYAAHYQKQRHLDFALFPHLFARRTYHHKETFGTNNEDLARVVDKAYRNARHNPLALNRHSTVTMVDAGFESEENHTFLEDERYREHIRILDCTRLTDGGSAAILATEAGLEKLGIQQADCTEIAAYGMKVRALGAETDPARMSNIRSAAQEAYHDAGITPGDIGLGEVHDCFSIAELQMYEALGLIDEGQAVFWLADGYPEADGSVPINPGGGLLGFGHPIGATGVKQVVEIWRQMKRRCGEYQITRQPAVAVTANLGGDDRTGIVMVHRDCG